MLRITDNDLLLFKYLFEEEYIKRKYILKYFWVFQSESHIRRRLGKLLSNQFLISKPDPLDVHAGTYIFPTSKALDYYDFTFEKQGSKINQRGNTKLKVYYPEKYSIKDEYNINELVHHDYLTEIRFILENKGVDYWQSEKMIYNKYKRTPDAIFNIQNGTYAVEFERRLKSPSRYERVFKRYEKVTDIKFNSIIYIIGRDNVYNFFENNLNPKFLQLETLWFEKYRIGKFEDLKTDKFIIKNPYLNKSTDLYQILDDHLKRKKAKNA